jgi:predicted amidohydrolase
MRVAATAWKLRPARSDSRYFAHAYDLISEAHDEGAQVVVLPELHCMELLQLEPSVKEQNSAKYLAQYAEGIEDWIKRISDSSGLTIIGGSHFRTTDHGIKNVCAIGIPGEDLVIVEKNKLTAYEQQVWELAPGSGLRKLPHHLGVLICYDSEFPEAGRALAESGVKALCVPAWTETIQGFWRVRYSCLARAIENQMFVIHSSLVGGIGYEPAPFSHGSAAILAPSIETLPAGPIIRETAENEEGIVIADLDFSVLDQARLQGAVTNWIDRDASTWVMDTNEHNG